MRPLNADARAAGTRGIFVTRTGEGFKIHHMAKVWIIAELQLMRENEPGYEHSRIYQALLRELKKRSKEIDGKG